jgi:tetratricopeptide (TPR) repeat protein
MKTKKQISYLSKAVSISLIIFLLVASSNCGKSTKSEKSAEEFTAEGWRLFEADDFAGAKPSFSQALARDINFADAYNGRGWCNLFLDLEDEAITDFDTANTKELDKPDAFVGLAAIYVGNQEFTKAITNTKAALFMDSTYQFSHKTSIDYLDLHLILAQAYYGLGGAYLDLAQQEVDYLNPDNNLDPAQSTTWIINGVNYGSYAEALLKEIQRLEENIGEL